MPDDDVQLVAQARRSRWYSESDERVPAPAPAQAADEDDVLSVGSGLEDLSDEENEVYRRQIVDEVRRDEEKAERRRLREDLDYDSESDDDADAGGG